jgi:hypothetical protein
MRQHQSKPIVDPRPVCSQVASSSDINSNLIHEYGLDYQQDLLRKHLRKNGVPWYQIEQQVYEVRSNRAPVLLTAEGAGVSHALSGAEAIGVVAMQILQRLHLPLVSGGECCVVGGRKTRILLACQPSIAQFAKS